MRYWGTDDPSRDEASAEFARVWAAVPKYVVSRTLDRVEHGATLLRDPEADVARLKEQDGGPLYVSGAETAARLAGLLDEIDVYAYPVIVAGGKPAWTVPMKLELIDSRTFASGVVYSRYDVTALKLRQLDRGAAVHHHVQARVARPRARRLVDHAQLQPHALGADLDRLVDVRARLGRAPEHVDDVDRLLDRVQRREAALAEHLVAGRVDRDHLHAVPLQQRGDAVRVAHRVRRAAHDRPRAGLGQRPADVVVHAHQPSTNSRSRSAFRGAKPSQSLLKYANTSAFSARPRTRSAH